MRLLSMRWLVVMALLKGVLGSALALSPTPRPSDHTIKSKNGLFCVAVNAIRKTSTVKRVRRGWFDKRLWSVPKYFENVEVSDDGTYLFVSSDCGLLTGCSKTTEVLWVWLSDGRARHFSVGDLVADMGRLERHQVMGEWRGSWGHTAGTSGEWLKLNTCEKKVLFANVKTGEVRSRLRPSEKP